MLRRLGFPDVGPHRRFVLAIVVDAVGSGVFLPVSLLYFLATTPLSLVHIGLALSAASLLQLPLGPLLGSVVDRVGAKRVLLAANLLEAVGFVGYVFVGSFWAVFAAASAVQLGQTAFWGSYSPVVATIAPAGERERWFGFLGALRNASFAIGGLVAALAITVGSESAFTAVVVVNASSYLLSFLLLLSVDTPEQAPYQGAAGEDSAGWRQVLKDRAYLVLVATNITYALTAISLNVAFPVYLTRTLDLPGWVTGTVFTLNTLMIGLGQGLVVNALAGSVRARIIMLGSLFSAAAYVVLLSASWTSVGVGVVLALIAAVVYTGGELVSGPVLSALSTDAAPARLRGRYVSLYQMSWTVSSAASPLAMTWLLARGAAALWLALIGVTVIGVLLARLLQRVMPEAALPVAAASVARPVPEPPPEPPPEPASVPGAASGG